MWLISFLLKQLYVLLGESLINCRILFLKSAQTFWIACRYIQIVPFNNCQRGKKLKKVMFKVKTGYIYGWSCDARAGL